MSSWADQNKIFISLLPVQILTLCTYGEAGKEGDEGIKAVLCVIRNRVLNLARYADSEITNKSTAWHGVILKQKQFSCFNPGDPGREKLLRFAEMWDTTIAGNSYVKKCYQYAQQLLSGQLPDVTSGATHYHANYVSPSWAPELVYLGTIGAHLFYQDKGETGTGTGSGSGSALASIIPGTIPGWAIFFLLSGILYYLFRKGV